MIHLTNCEDNCIIVKVHMKGAFILDKRKEYLSRCLEIEIYIRKHIDTQKRISRLYDEGKNEDTDKELYSLLKEFDSERVTLLSLEKRRQNVAVELDKEG